MYESHDADGCKNIFNRGGNGGLFGSGVLRRLERDGARIGYGVRQHELFAMVGKIFCVDAGDRLGERTLRVDLVFSGAIRL